MSQDPLRVGVIGVGRMGRHHARVMSREDDVEFLGVLDADAARAADTVETHGGVAFDSLEALLAARPDAVVVATPTTTHPELVIGLLERGVACLVEKPLAADAAESMRIADTAASSGTVLQVGHVVRFDPLMRSIGAIERLEPRFVQMERISPMTFRSVDVGVVLDMMIHDLDLLLMLVGSEPEEIHANAVSVLGAAEDVCNARLVFPAGEDGIRCVANVTASRLAMKTERRLRVIGPEHYVSADFATRTGTVVTKTANQSQLESVRRSLAAGEDLSNLDYLELVKVDQLVVKDGDPLTLQAREFLAAVREGRPPEVDARTGLAAVRTAERIVEAARASGSRMV